MSRPSSAATVESHFSLLPSHSHALTFARLHLPGVIILVHGVNSDGEWFDATERGLCEGLNARMARRDTQLAHPCVAAGQLKPVEYTPELTSKGFIDPARDDTTFIAPAENYSPVIRFRWGYKACKEELQEFGGNVWLNEHDYWGGGPFANGCSAVADLWTEGLEDSLFLWLTAQHFNPVPGRDVYSCPHRAYYVHAALRLARLIKSIRDKQADCPITVVCHSQGNMVGIAASFLADRLGVQADSYILSNAPLSLQEDNWMENWTQFSTRDSQGHRGRVSHEARLDTFRNFLELLRARAQEEDAQDRNAACAYFENTTPQDGSPAFTLKADRERYGLNGHTFGRVTVYCCPHDQVISAATVQGIGWLGLNDEEIKQVEPKDAAPARLFSQRVFAQGYEVGQAPGQYYHYLDNRWNKNDGAGRNGFWYPPSPRVRFSLSQAWAANTPQGKVGTAISLVILVPLKIPTVAVNAEPEDGWKIPIAAPKLPEAFFPGFGTGKTSRFDEGYDPLGAYLDKNKTALDTADPYDAHRIRTTSEGATDAPSGDAASEAQLRYEHRGRLRMKARRAGMADENGRVIGEDQPDQATDAYRRWRNAEIGAFLDESIDQNATDHSTIVTNEKHARMAMAYDVAMGVCRLTDADWQDLRVEADWRYASALASKDHPHVYLNAYFKTGKMTNADETQSRLHTWANDPAGEARRPERVIDDRA